MSSPTRPALALRCHGGLTSQQCVEQAVAAEHAGFSTVWFAENPFGRGAWPGAVRDDGAEARRIAKRSVAAMLTAYAQTASAATRAAISEYGRPEDFARAMSRLARGEAPEDVIDDGLLAEYAIAGTPEQCLAQAEVYAEAGVSELAIAPIGERPADDIARLGLAIK